VVLIGRILFAYFFGAVAGVGHVKRDQTMRGYAPQAGFPVPAAAGWVAGLWLMFGAASVGLGIWPDVGSLMIGAFTIPAALFFHRFWTLDDEKQKAPDTALLPKPRHHRSGGGVLRNLRHFGVRTALRHHCSYVRLLEARDARLPRRLPPEIEPGTRGGKGDEKHETTG
jgi:uncharacterized membrane protein YphA (DoxX/SURF4 family)